MKAPVENRQMIFGIDVDGVLANFVAGFSELIIDLTHENRFPYNYWYDREYPPTWDWPQHYGYSPEQIDRVWTAVKESPVFWSSLAPLPGVADLQRIPPHSRVYFITSRMGSTALSQTQAWIQQHLFQFVKRREWSAVISSHKGLVALGLDLDFYIDDYHKNVNSTCPVVPTYLLDEPYNRAVPIDTRVRRVASVDEALIHFQQRGVRP